MVGAGVFQGYTIKIPLFLLLPQNIAMPTKNLRLVLVLLSRFKMTEEN